MKRPVTLIQVAAEAGVSVSTVSRILTGSARVDAEKERVVREVIDRLKYRPNVNARTLVKGVSRTIGVLTQDIGSPHYSETLRGIEDGLRGTEYTPIVVSGHWDGQDERDAVELLISRRVDALIVLGGTMAESELADAARLVPTVVLGRQIASSNFDGATLTLDNFQGAVLVVEHLLQRGHRNIAHIAGLRDHADSQDRLKGYQAALARANIPFDAQLVVHGDYRESSGMLAMQRLLSRNCTFTAVFCGNDQMAYGARLELYRRGIRVPEDMSLVGFDDQIGSAYTTPPLTTVRQPVRELGSLLARYVLGQIHGEAVALVAPPLELVVRESTAFLRG